MRASPTKRRRGAPTWHGVALFAREFTKALTVSDRAHALLPDDLEIETNRAHALMFLGRREEARALYVAHKGKPLSEKDTRLWSAPSSSTLPNPEGGLDALDDGRHREKVATSP